jgi:hypothetical protein
MDNSLSGFIKDNMTGQSSATVNENGVTIQTFISDAIGDDEKLNEIETESKPEVVVLVGFPGYGKTSFVATCYQLLLQNGKIDDYEFYDSDTFIGLERRVYARRISETNDTPITKRTLRGESHLLTFRFKHPILGDKVVVFSDRSGENYKDYAYKTDSIISDKLIKYADRLLFFINCEDLIDHSFMTLKDDYDCLLRNMVANKIPSMGTTIDLLFNKNDLVNEDNKGRFETNKKSLIGLFTSLLKENSFSEYSIVSNDIKNTTNLKSLFLEIVSHTNNKKEKVNDSKLNIDWVKDIIQKK